MGCILQQRWNYPLWQTFCVYTVKTVVIICPVFHKYLSIIIFPLFPVWDVMVSCGWDFSQTLQQVYQGYWHCGCLGPVPALQFFTGYGTVTIATEILQVRDKGCTTKLRKINRYSYNSFKICSLVTLPSKPGVLADWMPVHSLLATDTHQLLNVTISELLSSDMVGVEMRIKWATITQNFPKLRLKETKSYKFSNKKCTQSWSHAHIRTE